MSIVMRKLMLVTVGTYRVKRCWITCILILLVRAWRKKRKKTWIPACPFLKIIDKQLCNVGCNSMASSCYFYFLNEDEWKERDFTIPKFIIVPFYWFFSIVLNVSLLHVWRWPQQNSLLISVKTMCWLFLQTWALMLRPCERWARGKFKRVLIKQNFKVIF